MKSFFCGRELFDNPVFTLVSAFKSDYQSVPVGGNSSGGRSLLSTSTKALRNKVACSSVSELSFKCVWSKMNVVRNTLAA